MSRANHISLKLFKGVLASDKPATKPVFDVTNGVVIDPYAAWAKEDINKFLHEAQLSGEELNKTFHKSWQKIKDSSQEELAIHQIIHYLTTYGTNFTGPVYIPDEALDIPVDVKLVSIQAFTEKELTEKCLNVLRSGTALAEDTLTNILTLLDNIGYQFTGDEGITNKEAIVRIAEVYGVYPSDPTEFFRYLVYRTTGETLLIKNDWMIEKIKQSTYNPSTAMKKHGLHKLATIFNRFKPLFLAYKNKCAPTINRISRLSKTQHKPLAQNPLNLATQRRIAPKKELPWLHNATPYALFKALSACYARADGQTSFLYRVRNGKSWAKQNPDTNKSTCEYNIGLIEKFLSVNYSLEGVKMYLPENIEYGVPTSEKMFVGNVPVGTKFLGESLAVGIYWENDWGARDLDLSAISTYEKVGWNGAYRNQSGTLLYSGDRTDASHGAVEYVHSLHGTNTPFLVCNNVFSGEPDCEYKIIVGQGDNINEEYMMNPNNLMVDEKTTSAQRQTLLGILMPYKGKKQSFTILNVAQGNLNISSLGNPNTEVALQALFEQWSNPLTLNHILRIVGAQIVEDPEDAEIDLSLDQLEKDTFINLFKQREV